MTRGYWVAVCATLILEVPLVVLLLPGKRSRVLVAAMLANVATNLFLNLAILPSHRQDGLLVGEGLAVLVEAAAYACVVLPEHRGRAVAVSGVANLVSYSLGPAAVAALGL